MLILSTHLHLGLSTFLFASGEDYKLRNFSLFNFSPPSCHVITVDQNILLSILSRNTAVSDPPLITEIKFRANPEPETKLYSCKL
jgi:hypothetical protein